MNIWDGFKRFLLFILFLVSLFRAINIRIEDIQTTLTAFPPTFFTERPILFLLSGFFLFLFITGLRHRNIPLTVLSTDIELMFDTADGSRVRITRIQRLRANRDDVTAYFQNLTVAGTGRIPREDIDFKIYGDPLNLLGWNITPTYTPKQGRYISGNEQAWEAIHTFNPPLPRFWYLFNLNTVTRTAKTLHIDQFKGNEESYEIQTPFYPHKKLTITVNFHPDRPPKVEECKALRIVANGVINDHLVHIDAGTDNREKLRLTIRGSRNQRHKIIWKYTI